MAQLVQNRKKKNMMHLHKHISCFHTEKNVVHECKKNPKNSTRRLNFLTQIAARDQQHIPYRRLESTNACLKPTLDNDGVRHVVTLL